MKHEFDEHIAEYRKTMDNALSLSGEDSAFFARYKAEKLAQWFAPLLDEPITILDFGCGDGLMTLFVKSLFTKATVFGVDPSHDSIEKAQQSEDGITFMGTNGKDLPFQDQSFDLIYAAGVFHHIPFEEHEQQMREIYRVLKPGGQFVLFELNPLNPLTVITFKRNPIDKNARMMTSWYSKKLLKKYGNTRTVFYCFFPNIFSRLRSLESYIVKFPLGALYAVIMKKS
jgi:ubiquinone/menaquinone biosynthesis C-methylase UbiE